jgi:putative restriction endonuclease
LDAAHILPDRDERGRPEIPNGLALRKIHHGAFDAALLGVAPDYRIRVRADVLAEIDGPMDVPRAERLRPNRDYLAERFEKFRAA